MNYNIFATALPEQVFSKRKEDVHPTVISVLGQAEDGISRPIIVSFDYNGQKVFGYQKLDGSPYCFNEMEYVISLLGEALSISMARIIRIYSDSDCRIPHSIVSISVTEDPNESFVSFRQMRDELFWDLKNGTLPYTDWINSWSKIRARKGSAVGNEWEVVATKSNDYIQCLKFPFKIANYWTAKHGITLIGFEMDIEKMVAFDVLVGQADRTPSNYGLIVNNATKTGRLAPLIDSGTLRKPYVHDDQNGFNQMLLERETLLTAALSMWDVRFTDVLSLFLHSEDLIYDLIRQNSDILAADDLEFLNSRIYASINLLRRHVISN